MFSYNHATNVRPKRHFRAMKLFTSHIQPTQAQGKHNHLPRSELRRTFLYGFPNQNSKIKIPKSLNGVLSHIPFRTFAAKLLGVVKICNQKISLQDAVRIKSAEFWLRLGQP